LGQLNQADATIVTLLWQGLLDTDNDVRRACAQALAQIGKRESGLRPLIEKKLLEALDDPKFEVRARFTDRSASLSSQISVTVTETVMRGERPY
jgi:HEAT repeat protein